MITSIIALAEAIKRKARLSSASNPKIAAAAEKIADVVLGTDDSELEVTDDMYDEVSDKDYEEMKDALEADDEESCDEGCGACSGCESHDDEDTAAENYPSMENLYFDTLKHRIFRGIPKKKLHKFLVYADSRPEIFNSFAKMAVDMRNAGHDTYSAKCIMEVIRWNTDMNSGQKMKINNSYTSLFAKLLISQDESFKEFFNLRK